MYFQHPFLFFYPESFFILPSQEYIEFNMLPATNGAEKNEKQEQLQSERKKKLKVYYQVYLQQIVKMRENNTKKIWTDDQDEFLLKLDSNTTDWNQISKIIKNTNPAICKRRHLRLKQQLIKWPKEVDAAIIHLSEQQNMKWPEIRKVVNDKFCAIHNIPKFTTNKIKERYMLYLRPGISKDEWNVQQDIEIIKVIKQFGKQWTKAIKFNKSLLNRTQLQLKNRYYGTLKFMQKKVLRKVTSILKSQCKK